MATPLAQVLINLIVAWALGCAVGWERTYNGRVAGLRTHGLVALSSAGVVSLAYLPLFAPAAFGPALRLDPSHLAQGVMTGLGFLGAGAIFKEGVSIQGLTTAAALWTSAALGLLCGVGLEAPALAATLVALATLTLLRAVEACIPARVVGFAVFRFAGDRAPDEAGLRRLLGDHQVMLQDVSYGRLGGGALIEYRGGVETRNAAAFEALAARLRDLPGLVEFDLARISK